MTQPGDVQEHFAYMSPLMETTKCKLSELLKKACQWANKIHHTHLAAQERWIAYCSCLKPALFYLLPSHTVSSRDLLPIQRVVNREILHSQNLNQTFPKAVLYGMTELGGLVIPTHHAENIAEKVIYILHHFQRNDEVGYKLQCSLWVAQMEVGIRDPILTTKYDGLISSHIIPNSWSV